ncbi:hypothetical protein [Vibrio crassostreae]|uniref:hypothetical protein n=1 Tax=Vibrio crassostreae TaxID=246167 RepID=UPI00104E991C|nr:hypothetical protein [Vibrio crassostreae]
MTRGRGSQLIIEQVDETLLVFYQRVVLFAGSVDALTGYVVKAVSALDDYGNVMVHMLDKS